MPECFNVRIYTSRIKIEGLEISELLVKPFRLLEIKYLPYTHLFCEYFLKSQKQYLVCYHHSHNFIKYNLHCRRVWCGRSPYLVKLEILRQILGRPIMTRIKSWSKLLVLFASAGLVSKNLPYSKLAFASNIGKWIRAFWIGVIAAKTPDHSSATVLSKTIARESLLRLLYSFYLWT